MQLTILGCYGPYPHVDGACSGYLISTKDTHILIDLGSGSLRNYFRHAKLENADGIFLSHLHTDHTSDIGVLKYAVEINGFRKTIFAPNDPAEEYKKLQYKNVFDLEEIDNNKKVKIKDLTISFCKMQHALTSYAIKVQAEEKTFVYSGDTGLCPQLRAFADNSDLFLCEAAILNTDEHKKSVHMSPYQVCDMVQNMNIKTLVLTHFYPGYLIESYKKETEIFKSQNIVFAEENKIYII